MGKLKLDISESVSAGSESRKDDVSFRPAFDVPENPPHAVVLNFHSASQSEQAAARPLTMESKFEVSGAA